MTAQATPANGAKWNFWIDRGGTFTDVVARTPDGRILAKKVLSENPGVYDDAALEGIRQFLEVASDAPIPAQHIESVKMGTTVATNALLERKGEKTLLVITQGLKDQIEIGYQARPDIFAKEIIKPQMLYSRVIEAAERVRADGTIELALDEDRLARDLKAALADGINSVAFAFMHAYAFPAHEKAAAALANKIGFAYVAASHQVSPLIKIVGRGDTTIADAYLSPILRRYVDKVAGALAALPLSPSPYGERAEAGPPWPAEGEGRPLARTNPTSSRPADFSNSEQAAAPHPNPLPVPATGRTGRGDDSAPRVMFMASSGGLTSADLFLGRDAILSGPAGGIVGMAETAKLAGFDKVIGFDMGGTSTDVSHFAGDYERSFETEVAGVRMRVPMMRIHTVAAGGGSILFYDGSRFRAGPESAGSNPGPKCYRRGGPLTVADANVMVGKLKADFFPKIFGPGRDQPLDEAAVREAFIEMTSRVAADTGEARTPEQVADGFIRIAVENMANAIKKISVQQGYDVTEYALQCFGSAGGQHACLIADTLGMETVLLHPLSGLLSAYGMGLANIRASREESIEAALDEATLARIDGLSGKLTTAAIEQVAAQGVTAGDIATETRVHVRYDGTDNALPVSLDSIDAMRTAFEADHLRRYGFVSPEKRVFAATIEVEAQGGGAHILEPDLPLTGSGAPDAKTTTRFFSGNAWHDAPVYFRDALKPGHKITGPALVIEPHQTVSIEPGWNLEVTKKNHLVLRRVVARAKERLGAKADPMLLEVFNNLFMSIAEQMGEALRNTAQSVNIKERLDFSCAVFDSTGALVANAPHMPVHLGSMDRSVETIIELNRGRMQPGDVYMLNAPYNGGTHLPDITVITPVFAPLVAPGDSPPGSRPPGAAASQAALPLSPSPYGERAEAGPLRPAEGEGRLLARTQSTIRHSTAVASSEQAAAPHPNPLPAKGRGEGTSPEILFYVASRGHHEDIGGLTPGSMTPKATHIDEEGVYIDNFKLVDRGRFLEAETHALLSGAKYPARRPDKNIADLKAHVAANAKGMTELDKMVRHFGLDVVKAYMGHVQDNAEESVRRLLSNLKDGEFRVEMDQGTHVAVTITVDRKNRSAVVDFAGTSPSPGNNFNAPAPVTRAATLYVFRLMCEQPIPMNAGCMKPITLKIPQGSLLAPVYPAAVVAGNVETSQIVTNCLLGALGAMGPSQGTMNNLTFGNASLQYYETICSGSPAGYFRDGRGFNGTSGVHVHMTNTRLTDPEILELRYPVVLETFGIRRGSGGKGKWCAGDGTYRRIRFLERMDCAILSGYRRVRPYGLDGGEPGQCGRNAVRRLSGVEEVLQGCDQTIIDAGEAIIIETPTGGGVGKA